MKVIGKIKLKLLYYDEITVGPDLYCKEVERK